MRATCMILELKVDHSVEYAIQQIKDRQYALRFMPKKEIIINLLTDVYWYDIMNI